MESPIASCGSNWTHVDVYSENRNELSAEHFEKIMSLNIIMIRDRSCFYDLSQIQNCYWARVQRSPMIWTNNNLIWIKGSKLLDHYDFSQM